MAEIYEEIVKFDEEDSFSKICGIRLAQEKDENGNCYTWTDISSEHLNPYGYIHGGMIYAMADTTAGYNARRFAKKTVTLDSSFHFIKNVSSGIVTAKAEAIRIGRKIMLWRIKVESETGLLLAEGVFTYYVIEPNDKA